MRVIVEDDADAVAQRAARITADFIHQKPSCVLGLPTGSTPLGLYRELIRMHREEGLDFSRVVTFNLDEYLGLGPLHLQSYRYFMQQHLFDHVNICPENTHVPDGLTRAFETYGRQYEHEIADAGGIDLQILGIGADGHIGFNEPGSSLDSRTRIKALASETIRDNARFFSREDDVPRLAITVGVGTILEARRCMLLATGRSKAAAVAAMIEGPVTAQITASALQWHRHVLALVDQEAGMELARRAYYEEVESARRLLEAGELRKLGIDRSESTSPSL